ncbi:MAG: hypothetical protein NVSMB24_28480 [Mucilaginibacter sp.]
MKKIRLLSFFFMTACSPQKFLSTAAVIGQTHPGPLIIYEIGEWNAGYVILNLVDAKNEHFNIRASRTPGLIAGAIYQQ